MKRLLVLFTLAVLLVVLPAAGAAKQTGSCSVAPNPAQISHDPNASPLAAFTVTASSDDHFYVGVQEPGAGPFNLSGPYTNGTTSIPWFTAYAGTGTVTVYSYWNVRKPIASCSFEVLP